MAKLAELNGSDFENSLNVNQGTSVVNLTQLPELTNQAVHDDFKHFKHLYLDFLYNQQGETLLLQQVLYNEHSLRWLEQITVGLQREQLLEMSESAQNQAKLNAHVLNQLYKVIINGCKVIKSYTQANKQFVSEQLIMKISEVIEKTRINEQET